MVSSDHYKRVRNLGMSLDITKIAQEMLDQLETEHVARKEGIILLHNKIIAEIDRLKAEAAQAETPAAAPTEATDGTSAAT